MTIASLVSIYFFILLVGYYVLRNKINHLQWTMFKFMIVVSIFINVGYVALRPVTILYNDLFQYFYIIVCIISFFSSSNKQLIANKKMLISFGLLVLSLVVGLINLIVNLNMPDVIPMAVQMDNVYYGLASTAIARFGINNITSLISLILFSLILFCSYKYLSDKDKIRELLDFIIFAFHIFFIFAIIELIINNLISPTVFREIVYRIFGVADIAKTYVPEARFGFYGFAGLFTEQSYISVMIIYYAILYTRGLTKRKDVYFYILSMLILIASGSSTGLFLLPFAIFIYLKESMVQRIRGGNHKLFLWIFLIISVGFASIMMFSNLDLIKQEMTPTIVKITSYFSGGSFKNDASAASGATRSFANQIAYHAFMSSPLLGVGIGTTRGYGIIPGFIVTFGFIGVVTYFYFIMRSFNILINRSNFLLLLIILSYSTIILSVWYIYYPAFIPIYAVFSKYNEQRIAS